tara:strand:- start:2162 stop:2827 length:666 start_codon:yes stop_codon:yes gene_type:complete
VWVENGKGDHMTTIQFDEKGLIPAVVQDHQTRKLLMVAYMNRESLTKTLESREAWFYSRSRENLWHKGETSGNFLIVKSIKLDCDGDTLLLEVDPKGPACHTGQDSCFNTDLSDLDNCNFIGADTDRNVFTDLFSIIEDRKLNPKNGSYTNKLFDEGVSRIAQKVVEEAGETAIAGVTGQKEGLASEISDLIYHVFVLISANDMSLEQVFAELSERRESGN